ncbi:MAG: hypothetical protein ABW346_10480, partial [Terrimicrobium sp.]
FDLRFFRRLLRASGCEYWRRDVLGDVGLVVGTTPLLQHSFAQTFGIAFAGFRKLDYLLRDDIVGNVAAINKPKRFPCHLIGKTHEPHCFGVEPVTI